MKSSYHAILGTMKRNSMKIRGKKYYWEAICGENEEGLLNKWRSEEEVILLWKYYLWRKLSIQREDLPIVSKRRLKREEEEKALWLEAWRRENW